LSSNKDLPVGDASKDTCNAKKPHSTDAGKKKPNSRTSVCEEKLIPGNMVPDIVELLVTMGLIQQQQEDAVTGKNQLRKQPRFAVHFGKPKQFLVTPTNILSEIAKAQAEIQLSRQRQEILKEALNMTDEQAAERVKHIVLQHPPVVDDPVYVQALRNLQVDGMLIAGTSGNTTAGHSNGSFSSKVRDGPGKSKSEVGGSGKNIGDGKRRLSGGNPAKRKRQKQKKELVSTGDGDKYSRKRVIAHSGDVAVGSQQKTFSTVLSRLPANSTSTSSAQLSKQPVEGIPSASTNYK